MLQSSKLGNNRVPLPSIRIIFLVFVSLWYLRGIGTLDTGMVSGVALHTNMEHSCLGCLGRAFLILLFVYYSILASIWLTCHAQECTLELTPPGYRTKTVVFARTQLHSSQATKVDKAGNFLSVDQSKYEPPPRGDKKKKKGYKSGAYKGPDENGEYRSYSIKFYPKTPSTVEKTEEDVDDGDFGPVKDFMQLEQLEDGSEILVMHMRKFGLSQSRTRIRSSINKVESYMKRRRQKLLVKESAPLPWQGLLLVIFGLLGLMLTLLIGQFWEEAPRKQGGPGARRNVPMASSKTRPTFVVDTGRPSKYPPGYNYNKKY